MAITDGTELELTLLFEFENKCLRGPTLSFRAIWEGAASSDFAIAKDLAFDLVRDGLLALLWSPAAAAAYVSIGCIVRHATVPRAKVADLRWYTPGQRAGWTTQPSLSRVVTVHRAAPPQPILFSRHRWWGPMTRDIHQGSLELASFQQWRALARWFDTSYITSGLGWGWSPVIRPSVGSSKEIWSSDALPELRPVRRSTIDDSRNRRR